MRQTSDPSKYLRIYLNDHLAGSVAGYELARRCASSNKESELGRWLEGTFIGELVEDRATLQTIMDRFGIGGSRVKVGLAWLGEKAGRLKPNGEVRAYSPLSRVIELEGLVIGVRGKLAGWQAIRACFEGDERLDGIDLDALIERALRQIAQLEEHHGPAARTALQASG